MSPRKTWEYCDIPICGMYHCSATCCHPARHGNTATFLYVVRIHHVTPQDMEILRHSYMWWVWCYTMSPRKTLEYCDIPICGEYGATLCHPRKTWEYCDIPICGKNGVTQCHPARHGNTATFLYVVCMVLHGVTPQDMGILRHSYMW